MKKAYLQTKQLPKGWIAPLHKFARPARAAIVFFVAFFLTSAFAAASADKPVDNRNFSSTGSGGAVSCGHPAAAAVAIEILKNGGNAVDAAVGASFMLGVVDFSNSGIGGDGFALICSPSGSVIAFDGSTRRPGLKKQNATQNHAGLPTLPEMLLKLLRLYGRKSSAEIMAPAVSTCLNGFKVSSYLEKVVEKKLLTTKDSTTTAFLAPDGYPIRAGQTFKQPVLARTLLQMATDGGSSFYRGDEARKTLADMQKKGSAYQPEDFAHYRSLPVKPLRYDYREFSIYGNPPPASSLATIKLALDLLKSGVTLFPGNSDELLQIAKIGQKVISTKYNGLAACLNDHDKFFAMVDTALLTGNDETEITDTNTTHLCVWDKEGMAVSITLTLGNHFGTGDLAPGGFFYNNGLRNYTGQVAGYPADYPETAGPISAKSPIVVTRNGKAWLILGGAGADRIIFNTAVTMARVISGYGLRQSIAAPRFYLDYRNLLTLEWHPNLQLLKETSAVHPDVSIKAGCDDFFGLVSAICRNRNGSLEAAADHRRDGSCESEP